METKDYYEDEGDLLSDFRKQYSGAFIEKDNQDPFKNDPDIKQAEKTDKLDIFNMKYL